ncbi:centrosomal protein of 41 kDa isoform X3 [Hippopotamus amphibius kiboko]|uniref:centrosomal protein of 41 kDa isoform X3 n=1 Tax=Hippopotamus amphibius kiboko TaxID=575201 RepID=UPI00259803A1|nr:centrosomal protein of 41 kDa isoform X3 [Hippopotamus amphibius kiboko]
MSVRRHIGNPEYLTKRIPQNPRYQHVKSRLDTDYRYKKDELFKRLKVTTFAQLVIQVASLSDQTLEVTAEEIQRLEDNDSATSDPDAEITAKTNGKESPGEQSPSPVQCINNEGAGDSSRSTLQSVISGVGELDLDKGLVKKVEPNTKDKPYADCPFLLLDVRDRDSYQQCHIVGAYSYPIATLSRTMNPYSNDILEYKNAHGKIIILYDDDERLASQAATTMCERGFENLFMLSGGLKVLAQKFPEGLITGSLPASCQQALPPGSARKRSSPKVPPPPAESKWRFTPEDLKKIEYYLEEDQGPADNPSRLSQANASGRDSKVPGARSSQNLPAGGHAGHQNPRLLGSGHLQGKPWK